MKKWVGGQMDKIGTPIEKMNSDKFQSNSDDFLKYISFYIEEQKKIKLGGGIIADTLPYVAAIARIYCKTNLLQVYKITKKNIDNLPIKCNLLLQFENCTISCYLSFGIEYDNQITFFSKNKKIIVNRAFSTPVNTNMTIKYYYLNSQVLKETQQRKIFKPELEEIFLWHYPINSVGWCFLREIKQN